MAISGVGSHGARQSSGLGNSAGFVRKRPLVLAIESGAVEDLSAPFPLWHVALLAGVGAWACVLGYTLKDHFGMLFPFGGILLLTTPLFLIATFFKRQRVFESYRELIWQALADLETTYAGVHEYLFELDHRTSRYFHCVTNTKVRSYFKLRQIEYGLHDFLVHLERAKVCPTKRDLLTAFALLQQPFAYRDGFDFCAGNAFQVSLADLEATVAQLRGELEQGLRGIEHEIREQSLRGSINPPKA